MRVVFFCYPKRGQKMFRKAERFTKSTDSRTFFAITKQILSLVMLRIFTVSYKTLRFDVVYWLKNYQYIRLCI